MATALAPLIDYEFDATATAVAAAESSAYCGPAIESRRQRYLLPLIAYRDTYFRLNQPIEISVYTEDGLWICESELISSSVHGDTLSDAVQTFCEDFAVLWDEIAKAPDDNLAPDAQRLKGILRLLVRAVEKVR